MSSATFPLAWESFFFFIFGFDHDNINLQHISSDLSQKHTNNIESIFKLYLKKRTHNEVHYLQPKDDLKQSATNNCIKRLIASGSDDWTDEAITIFFNALNHHFQLQLTHLQLNFMTK